VPAFLESLEGFRALWPALRRQHERGALIAANCSATFLLAETGLLDHRAATTSWWLTRAFRQRYPLVDLRSNETVTEQDGLLCSGAATAYLSLALRLVEKFAGPGIAAATAKTMLIDTNQLSQAPYKVLTMQNNLPHADQLVQQAQRWMERRLRQPFTLGDLAGELGVSERTLIRRFKQALGSTPVGHLQTLRIEFAKSLLETTVLTVDAVSERVGYIDPSSFRRLFKRETGLAPREYHQRFARRHQAPAN
jgi:transcriptional regulator GlxA family with amidase domain